MHTYSDTRIQEVLTERERSRAWLARKMEVSETLVHRVLDGERRITPSFVERACRALELTEAELFIGDSIPMRIGNKEVDRAVS